MDSWDLWVLGVHQKPAGVTGFNGVRVDSGKVGTEVMPGPADRKLNGFTMDGGAGYKNQMQIF
ncbi:hypothetical protein [Marinobacter sp. NFXS9]|uniref:hypothetical protein n=1 Tax=Marinobacter sp. NFXS9 TaxID=2818433 RepID=UPI0032DFAE6F